jgi:hypothetical protein
MSAAATTALYVLAGTGAAAWALAAALVIAWLQLKPWSTADRDHAAKVATLPYALFAFGCWYRRLGTWLRSQVPSPMLAAELASVFLKSQVGTAALLLAARGRGNGAVFALPERMPVVAIGQPRGRPSRRCSHVQSRVQSRGARPLCNLPCGSILLGVPQSATPPPPPQRCSSRSWSWGCPRPSRVAP